MPIICRYNEIALKGKNRGFFEKVLMDNLSVKFKRELGDNFSRVKKISGKILIEISDSPESIQKATELIQKTFGIVSFSFAQKSSQEIEHLKVDCWNLIKDEKFETFRVTTQRSNKDFPLTSEEINREVGGFLFEKSKKGVRMKNADIECFIEIVEKDAFIYTRKLKGPGGLPVGTGGRALAMLSGGIDSPVAAYFGIKRGVKVNFMHFHSLPYTSAASNEKVEMLAKILLKFQPKATIFMVPFAELQKEIMMKTPEKLRVILYRRMMLRIAEKVAEKNNFLALYTGDSVGQVASQTLENIKAVEQAVTIPVLRPLIGLDKDEIIEIAQKIGTFETSIIPHEDCCTRLMPKKPETRAKLEEVLEAEKNLDIEKMIQSAIDATEIKIIRV